MSGVIAAPHHLATAVGVNVLQSGGNAFDAAVATSLAISVTQPYHSGIGGGCNITYLSASGEAAHINARGSAPQALTREVFFGADGKPAYNLLKAGGLALTVPSLVAGLSALHRSRGRLSWSQVCSAAIPLAKDGFTADFVLARVYERAETRGKLARYAQQSPFATPTREGEQVVQPQLARTLEHVAEDPRALHEGTVAQQLATAVQRNGGVLSIDDMRTYQPNATPLQTVQYRGWQVLAPGLPTVGALQTLLALRILSRFSLRDSGIGSAQTQHLIAEAVRATYLERAKLENAQVAAALADDALAERLVAEIDLNRAKRGSSEPDDRTDETCTSHFCVADDEGNVVSQTQTVRSHFGSGLIDPETGIVFNDSVGDFSLEPGEVTTQGIRYAGRYNLLEPGTEPASSQSPVIALHPETGDLIAAGAAGGPRIVSAAVQTLVNQIDFGLNAQLSVSLPRVHSHGPVTYVEPHSAVADALERLGHPLETSTFAGIAQMICRRDGRWEGGADPRGPGSVAVLAQEGTVRRYGYRD